VSRCDIRLDELVGRKVRDERGRFAGRIHELCADIEQHVDGNDYVVHEYRLCSIGPLEFLGGSYFIRELLHTLHLARTDRYVVPWQQLDLSDPTHPTLTISRDALTRTTD
jgi:sporulation protein YlmC with PRC-barrel domain